MKALWQAVIIDIQPLTNVKTPCVVGYASSQLPHGLSIQIQTGDAPDHGCQFLPLIQVTEEPAKNQCIENFAKLQYDSMFLCFFV